MNKYQIILADDQAILRDGIKRIINDSNEFEVVGEARDGYELLAVLKKKAADMVILEASLPRLMGIEAAGEIRKLYPKIEIVFLSMHKSREYLRLAISTGAKGYLVKEDTGNDLIHAIDKIRKGGTYISSWILKDLSTDFIDIFRKGDRCNNEILTPREKQVLKLIAEGKTNREIAELLFISSHTVHNHRKNIKKKLNMTKSIELVTYALKKGMI